MHERIEPFAFYPIMRQDARIIIYTQGNAVSCDNLTPLALAPTALIERRAPDRFGTLAVGLVRSHGRGAIAARARAPSDGGMALRFCIDARCPDVMTYDHPTRRSRKG
jgi:hypothetical protein